MAARRRYAGSTKRTQNGALPVVRWLQLGAVGVGMGIALATSPAAIASVDDTATSVSSEAAKPAAVHRGPAVDRHSAAPAASVLARNIGQRPGSAAAVPTATGAAGVVSAPRRSGTAVTAGAANSSSSVATPVASTAAKTTASATATDPLGDIAAFLGNADCGASPVAAQSPATQSPTAAATAAAAGRIATPAPNAATIAITNWFSATWNWLESANNPVATALQNVLVGVQSTLFSPAPTVRPVQYTAWTPGDPILGALRYIQPGGAPVSFQLTTAPTSGTVQLLSDGTYTYTPGANFTGTDTFTAAVTSGGINLLDPLTPRTANVTVTINPQLPVMLTDGININNRTSQPVVLRAITTTPGFEDSVGSKPVWSYWQPGDYMHVEVTKYLFTSYDAYFTFLACGDANCNTQYADKWIVKISPDIAGDTYVFCTQGACTYVDNSPFSLRNSINLLDPGAGARGTPASAASAAPPAESPAATTRRIKQVQLA